MALGEQRARVSARPPPTSSLHDIDDLYDTNGFDDDEDNNNAKSEAAAAVHPLASKGAQPAKQPAKTSAGTKTGSKLEFDVWVARKDKYERVAKALAQLNNERASNDDAWLDVAVSLAATDVVLKTGRTERCDCPGICRDPAHAVTKQRTRCACPARKCSLCKRCVITTPGEITDKMINALAPYKLEPSQSMLALAERIVATGDGKPLKPGQPKITTSVLRMASAVLAQCSVLTNPDGTRLQRPCSCPVRSLGDLWVKWTTKYHTFSRVPLTEAETKQFSNGTRQMMEFDEEAKLYYMTLKWHQAAKPQKGDTAKIAARRALTPDQKQQNAFFLSLCKKNWKSAQITVVKHLQEKMGRFFMLPEEKRTRLPEEYELQVLTALGVKRMLQWVEQDQEALDNAKKDEQKEKADGGVVAHNAWVKRKDRLRIRMPESTTETSSKPTKSAKKQPPRMDFSSGKGVVRPKTVKFPSSTVEIMKNSGLKYVHAMNEGFQGRGGDLEKCKQQLVTKGHILKANFNTKGDDDDDNAPFSKDRYHFERQNNPAIVKKREVVKQRETQRQERYTAWLAHKALKDKAFQYLAHLPTPKRQKEEAKEGEDGPSESDAQVRWIEVGKALKAVDRGLLEAWVRWSDGFVSAPRCRMLWEGFTPVACDVHCSSSAIRDVFLKLLHRTGVNYKQAFLAHCDKKHKKALALGLDDIPDEMTDQEKMERFESLDKREFARLLQDLGIVLQPEELQRVLEYFDQDGNQLVSMKEFLDVVGDKRRRHGDTDLLLQNVCLWETVCHECGMLNAFQLVIGSTKPGEHRMRAELPGHVKRRQTTRCQPECDMHELKQTAPKTCPFATWNDEKATPFLKKLELWSAEHREQHVLQKLVTDGQPPDAPVLYREEDDDPDSEHDPTTTLCLRWQPPPVRGNNGAAFYMLETIGAEGTSSFRLNEYREIYRDPKDYKDNNGQPRYQYVVTGLTPNTKYGFRLRALNGFGAGPYTFAYFITAPATPPAPMVLKVTANSIELMWESSSYFRRQLKELRRVFDEADTDGNGVISRDEFMEELERRKPRLLVFLQKTQAATNGGLSIFDAIETEDNEAISWDEFVRFFQDSWDEINDLETSRSSVKTQASRKPTPEVNNKPTGCRYILKQCTNEARGEYVEIYRGQQPRFTVHGLASASTYQFRVQAVNEEDRFSLHSEPTVVNTLLPTPAPPNLVEMACTSTSVKLKWPTTNARPCLSYEAIQARSKLTTVRKGASNNDDVTRILKEWAQETSIDDGSVDFRAKFDRYDVDKSEFIDLPEFKTLLEELGVPATQERLAAYLEEFDTDNDGKISFDEFKRWWTKTDVQYVLKRDAGATVNDTAASQAMRIVCYRGKDTSVSVSGLAPNTVYTFRLRVVSSHASSPLSDALDVCTPPQAPSCAGMIVVLASRAQICWHPGQNGASRYIVECKGVETLPSSDTATSKRVNGSDWKRVYEGSDTLTTLGELSPNTVYRLRVFAVNSMGLMSEQSTVTQFCTLSKEEERRRGVANLRPSAAADHFTIECCDEGDVVAGDTILFSERLVQTDSGKILAESEVSRSTSSSDSKLATSSVYSTTSYRSADGDNEPIGERTVAARVVGIKRHEKIGNVVNMIVVWSTVQLYEDSKKPSQQVRTTRVNSGSVHTTSHALAMRSNTGALATDLKIARRERSLYRYDVFRREWQDERARSPQTWDK
ncbi:hypothetical protein Poli38472_013032 [Pythium oligandrum]|uniref:Calmodulin n=1 Tax=Pythium oligandrum TaxID=41045 RepID=A0A8K1FHY5_PYTOL|nr:hypothetical protein Poli38472_013032 [Pythium oligandrum]|eukprot:TMW64410.1 hypothetical protein Poli38472_013032 [Pythium oligandrum]